MIIGKNKIKPITLLFKKNILTFASLAALFSTGCSHDKNVSKTYEETRSREATVAAARETEAKRYVEIEFNEGSTMLTERAKTALKSAVKDTPLSEKLDEVIVLSWADENFPSKDIKKLSKKQRDLADQRNKNVKEYVKGLRDVDVDSYNMAERPSAFSKLFNTADAELKNSMLEAGLSTTADKADYSSKASHSLIFIKTKQ